MADRIDEVDRVQRLLRQIENASDSTSKAGAASRPGSPGAGASTVRFPSSDPSCPSPIARLPGRRQEPLPRGGAHASRLRRSHPEAAQAAERAARQPREAPARARLPRHVQQQRERRSIAGRCGRRWVPAIYRGVAHTAGRHPRLVWARVLWPLQPPDAPQAAAVLCPSRRAASLGRAH